jgi:hypothetical protein
MKPNEPLTRATLEAYDPEPSRSGGQERYLCPYCGDNKPRDSKHKSLRLAPTTGLFTCARCDTSGQLKDNWKKSNPRERSRAALKKSFGLTPSAVPTPDTGKPLDRALLRKLQPLAGTHGEAYLQGRGIPLELANKAGVRFGLSYGQPAVWFPVRDLEGTLVAVQACHIADGAKRTYGPKKLGVYATPGALTAHPTVLVEAPIDALSLAACGLPAIALIGCDMCDWLPKLLAKQAQTLGSRYVLVATDNDEAGDAAVTKWVYALAYYGAKYERLRPSEKDWNDLIQGTPEQLRTVIEGQVIPRPIEEGNAYDQYGYYHPAWDRMLDLKGDIGGDIAIAPAKVQNWLQEHQ